MKPGADWVHATRSVLAVVADLASVGTAATLLILVGWFALASAWNGWRSSAGALSQRAEAGRQPSFGVQPPASGPALQTTLGRWVLGERSARVAVIEFSDFECPFCGRFSRDVFPAIRSSFVDSGAVLYGFRHFPLSDIHPLAKGAAGWAECAGEQGRFWDAHALLFDQQDRLGADDLATGARTLGLDREKLEACLMSIADAMVEGDRSAGVRLGVRGTPTFVIGRLLPDGTVDVMRKITGLSTAEVFGRAIAAVASQ